MSFDIKGKKCTTRRGFFKNITAGAGGMALASSLGNTWMSGQSGLMAAPADAQSSDGTIYGKYFLSDDGTPPKSLMRRGTP